MVLLGLGVGVLTVIGTGAHAIRGHAPNASSRTKADPSSAITVRVEVAPDVAPSLVARAFAEAAAVWGPLGVSFSWHLADSVNPATDRAALRVILGDEPGSSQGDVASLGWIDFPEPGKPEPIIHLSRANAFRPGPWAVRWRTSWGTTCSPRPRTHAAA
jgi:hypothetical protein